jgi:hypothetical protein
MTTLCVSVIVAAFVLAAAFTATFVVMLRPQRHWSDTEPNVPPRTDKA